MQALSTSAQSIETERKTFAMMANAARGLEQVMKSNLGPSGSLKMLVSAAGSIKLTKNGATLLKEMEIRHPVTAVIAQTVDMQSRFVGDGAISLVLLISELIMGAEKLINEGIHSSFIVEGMVIAFKQAVQILEEIKIKTDLNRATILNVAECCVRTKLHSSMAQMISEQIVDAIQCIYDRQTNQADLHMVEIMTMKHKTAKETELIRGIVMDHAARHPFMPKEAKNCYILTCNVSMEYEKTEVNAKVMYSSSTDRVEMADGEREYIDKRARQIVALKHQVCKNNEGFVVLNQGGIDPPCLNILAEAGIIALRRCKRRNMERLTLCCGGVAVNTTEGLRESMLGHAGHVRQINLGEENYTIVDQVQNPKSVTILIKGPNDYTIDQIKGSIHNGLMAVYSTMRDMFLLPGAGAFELTAVRRLRQFAALKMMGNKQRFGVELFADALESIPKALSQNAGFDTQDLLMTSAGIDTQVHKKPLGINLNTGELSDPVERGIYDNYSVKMNVLQAAMMMGQNLLSVDAVIKSAPEGMRKKAPAQMAS